MKKKFWLVLALLVNSVPVWAGDSYTTSNGAKIYATDRFVSVGVSTKTIVLDLPSHWENLGRIKMTIRADRGAFHPSVYVRKYEEIDSGSREKLDDGIGPQDEILRGVEIENGKCDDCHVSYTRSFMNGAEAPSFFVEMYLVPNLRLGSYEVILYPESNPDDQIRYFVKSIGGSTERDSRARFKKLDVINWFIRTKVPTQEE